MVIFICLASISVHAEMNLQTLDRALKTIEYQVAKENIIEEKKIEAQAAEDSSELLFWKLSEIRDEYAFYQIDSAMVYSLKSYKVAKYLNRSDLLSIAAGKALSHDEACAYLTRVGLCARDYLERDVDASLSGGEVKRIEIATVLARKSPVMIFDEPEAGIDLWSFARLTETFREIHDQKLATIIIISHQERIIRLADEIILIAGGRLLDRGSVERIYPKIIAETVTGCNMLEVDKKC